MEQTLTKITASQMDHLSRGAAALGAGGGGDPYVGALLAKQALLEFGDVVVTPLHEVPDDAVVLTSAMMGAPTVMLEKLPSLEEVTGTVHALSDRLGKAVTHIACVEIGGVNSTIPIAAAAALGLPLLDADGMGRAFPELQMVLPTLYGISSSPWAIGDEKGNTVVMDTADNLWTERVARVACVEMGCAVITSGYAMSGAQARESFVPDSLTKCIRIGEEIERARVGKVDPVTAVVDLLGGKELFSGKVIDVARATSGGFARGSVKISDDARTLTIFFQNEHLVAQLDDEVLVTTPDLIMVLESDNGEPVTTEGLRYGQRVRVIAAPADERWHSPEGLDLVGPRYFKYDMLPHRFDGAVESYADTARADG